MNRNPLAADQNLETRPVDGYTLELAAKVCDEHAAFFRSDGGGISEGVQCCAQAIRALAPPSSSPAARPGEAYRERLRQQIASDPDLENDAGSSPAVPQEGVTPSESSIPMLGGAYVTQGGEHVTMVKIHNVGTPYETLEDEAGIQRYSRRLDDMGRVTGTAHDYSDPLNLQRPIRAIALREIRAESALLASEAVRRGVAQEMLQETRRFLGNIPFIQDERHDGARVALTRLLASLEHIVSQAPTGGEGC